MRNSVLFVLAVATISVYGCIEEPEIDFLQFPSKQKPKEVEVKPSPILTTPQGGMLTVFLDDNQTSPPDASGNPYWTADDISKNPTLLFKPDTEQIGKVQRVSLLIHPFINGSPDWNSVYEVVNPKRFIDTVPVR